MSFVRKYYEYSTQPTLPVQSAYKLLWKLSTENGSKRATAYAYVGETNYQSHAIQYALLTRQCNQDDILLGDINPHTRQFEEYDRRMPARVKHDGNGNIIAMDVPEGQIQRLKTLDQLLGIGNIEIVQQISAA
ncbi:MAG: hypothetical protein QS98_C0003G0014 [archaeon GW2011_AR3]|nr:MAG: hypothetical protein QS98_C0003G0014 [archaeon GW2011_AR3]MBS3110058.1 hypothetical protein [Candidatus Woesearchaeota archaeon]